MEFKRHFSFRTAERTVLTKTDIDRILRHNLYFKIGMDIKKKHCCHYLFYSVSDNQHFIMVVDEQSNEAITMLPLHYAGWCISDEMLTKSKLSTIFYLSILPVVYDDSPLKSKVRFLMSRTNPFVKKKEIKKFFEEHFSYFLTPYFLNHKDLFINEFKDIRSQMIIFLINSYSELINDLNQVSQSNNFAKIINIRVFLKKYSECYTIKKKIFDDLTINDIQNDKYDFIKKLSKEYAHINDINDILKLVIETNKETLEISLN